MGAEAGAIGHRPAGTGTTRVNDHPLVDALVGNVKTRADFARARDEGWYRVPVATVPESLRDPLLRGRVRSLALYLPSAFRDEGCQVRWVAPIRAVVERQRRELLPDEPEHPRADQPYLRLDLGPLNLLPHPIPSQRLRRIVLIPTTRAKLETAGEINDLFHASPLEDVLWRALKDDGIEAEREYFVDGDWQRRYALDFAIFGNAGNLDVECDGDAYHANPVKAAYDNRRNNFLTARGWKVLRFSTAQIREALPDVLTYVRATLKQCGGASMIDHPVTFADVEPLPDALWQPALWAAEEATGRTVEPRRPERRNTPGSARRGSHGRRRARPDLAAAGSPEADESSVPPVRTRSLWDGVEAEPGEA
jgi:very-short-patch-repair endonuclease